MNELTIRTGAGDDLSQHKHPQARTGWVTVTEVAEPGDDRMQKIRGAVPPISLTAAVA